MTNTKTQKDFAADRTVQDLYGQDLFRVVGPADIRMSDNGNGRIGRRVYLQVEHYDKETGKTTFPVMSEFIDTEKAHSHIVEKFYANLEKGQLLFIDYKVSEKYNNILSISKREANNPY